MGHQKLTYGFRGESTSLPHEDRFSPQNEADYERLARIAAAEEAGTDLLLDVRSIELYVYISRKTVYRLVRQGDVLLDGFPRKVSQAQWLVEKFGDKFDTIAVYLNLPESLMLKRIQNRIAEGGGRADDADSLAVRRRLNNFRQETMPAIDWLRSVKNVRFLEIPIADAPIDVNYKTLKNALVANKVVKAR